VVIKLNDCIYNNDKIECDILKIKQCEHCAFYKSKSKYQKVYDIDTIFRIEEKSKLRDELI
jgi:hypothetical protein